jgi:hypothetical protein
MESEISNALDNWIDGWELCLGGELSFIDVYVKPVENGKRIFYIPAREFNDKHLSNWVEGIEDASRADFMIDEPEVFYDMSEPRFGWGKYAETDALETFKGNLPKDFDD